MGASGIGMFNTALAIISIFTILTVGMGKSTSQLVSANISDKIVAFEHARNGTFASIITGIIIGSILIVVSFVIDAPLVFLTEASVSTILFITGLVMLVTGIRDALVSNLAAVGEYDEIAKNNAVGPLFQLTFGLLFIILIKYSIIPNSIILFLFLFGVIAQTLFVSRYLKLLWFNTQIFRFNHVDRRFFKIMRQGFYFSITDLIPSGLLGQVILLILLIFTQAAYEFKVVGAFSIILGYSFGGLIVTGFAWPLITSVAEAYGKKDNSKIRYYLHLIVKIFFYITFLILVIDIGLSRGIIGVFHGSNYLEAPTDVWVPFMLVIAAFAVGGFEYILCGILLGVGKGRVAAVYLGSLSLVTIGVTCLCLWLDIFHGIPLINASFGFLISTLIMLPIAPYLIRKQIQQKVPLLIGVRSLAALASTIGIAALLMWPPLNLIPLSNVWLIIPMAIVLVVIYLLLLIFFGAISQEDFRLLERKAAEYGLKNTIDPLLNILRKLMQISPFCDSKKCLEPK